MTSNPFYDIPMTLTRRARGAWPIVGAVLALAARDPLSFTQSGPPAAAARTVTASISGRLLAPEGGRLASGAVILSSIENDGRTAAEEVWIGADGAFRFGGVAPGRYRIRARARSAAAGPSLFATFVLTMEGRDLDNVQLILRPGGTLDGQVTAEPTHAARRPALSNLRVRAPLADDEGEAGDRLGGIVQPDGRFALGDLMIGDHQVLVEGLPYPWVVASVLVGGRDIADSGFEVLEGQHVRAARITITDRASEVSGRVRDQGAPVADAPVLVYPVAPQFWMRVHRRMRLMRTDAEGRFSVRGLPEGEYLAIASAAIDQRDLGRRERLDAMRPRATPLSISGPEARVSIDLPLVALVPDAPVATR